MRPNVACLIILVLALAGGTYSILRQSSALEDLGMAIRLLENEALTQTLETTWTDADGLTHTVKTPRLENESQEDWGARHKEGVDALKALYPPA